MGYVYIQLGIVVFFLLFSYLIEKKKAYWLINNYNSRTEMEKEILVANRYPQRLGKLFRYIALGLVVFVVLSIFDIPYIEELSFVFMLAMLFGGLIYLSKYEVQGKQKQSYALGILLAVGTTLIIGILSYLGFKESPLVLNGTTFEIRGQYGERWNYDEVEKVELVNELPNVQTKVNGYGFSNRSKGVFRMSGVGVGKLFIYHDHEPFIHIEFTDDSFVYINASDPDVTKEWYNGLQAKVEQ